MFRKFNITYSIIKILIICRYAFTFKCNLHAQWFITLKCLPPNFINDQEPSQLTITIHYYLHYLAILWCLSFCDTHIRLSAACLHFLLLNRCIYHDCLCLFRQCVLGVWKAGHLFLAHRHSD